MVDFLRPIPGLWKQKPQMWGPPDRVAWAVRDYFGGEIGISDSSINLFAPFFESAGNKIVDYAHFLTGTIVNSGTWSSGGLYLNSLSQYVDFADNVNLRIPDNSGFSLIVIFSLSSIRNYNGIISKTNAYIPAPYDSYINSSGTLTFYLYEGSSENTYVTLSGFVANKIYHLIMTYDPADAKGRIYLNGECKSVSWARPVNVSDGSWNLRIGNRNDNVTVANAKFYQAAVLKKCLKDSQIKLMYDNPYAAIQPRSFPRYFYLPSNPLAMLYYRTANAADLITTNDWTQYSEPFISDGFVQIKVENQ